MKYLDYQNKLCFLLSAMLLFSCSNGVDCNFSAKLASENECIIIVNKLPNSILFEAEGINPITKKECKCTEGDR